MFKLSKADVRDVDPNLAEKYLALNTEEAHPTI